MPTAASQSCHLAFREFPRVCALTPNTPSQSCHLAFRDTLSISIEVSLNSSVIVFSMKIASIMLKWLTHVFSTKMAMIKVSSIDGVNCVVDQCMSVVVIVAAVLHGSGVN